jgi:hypothetical protein
VTGERPLLVAAGWMSVAACLLHLATIVGGGDWYRFFGAGEQMARAAEAGYIAPVVITLLISAVLACWAGYAFAAARGRLVPLLRTALIAISLLLLARAAMVFTPYFWLPEHGQSFKIWSSAICLIMGLCFAVGTWQAWPQLSKKDQINDLP